MIVVLAIMSGWRKGFNEDDGFWEVYDLYRRTAIVVTMLLTTIMVLSVPFTYEAINVMLETIGDVDFFKTTMPKLEGCMEEYNIKEALEVSNQKVFDQLVMIYI